MSINVIAIATESGVPIFSRKRGNGDNIQFSTIASLHGINMFSKCHNLSMVNTIVDGGIILWKEYCKSVTLIGIASGGLESDLELLLSYIHNVMIFCIGKKELDSLKNIDQIKRDFRQFYPIIDLLMESLDSSAVCSPHPTLTVDLIQSMLCPQAQQLQQALDKYAESVTGRWASLYVHGHLAATSSDWAELDPREARLLQLLVCTQDGVPLRETPVYLPQMSPNIAFRAVTCKLLADVYVLVICGATPVLSQIDEIVIQCWENYAQLIKEAKLIHPRNFPHSVNFEQSLLALMLVKCSVSRSVWWRRERGSAGGAGGGAHGAGVVRALYVSAARVMRTGGGEDARGVGNEGDEEQAEQDRLSSMTETYWCSEYYNCHGYRSGDLLCCAVYSTAVPTHTMRLLTKQLVQDLSANKDIYW